MPQVDWLKISIDGAFYETFGEAGLDIIFLDADEKVQLTSWSYIQNVEEIDESVQCLAAQWCRKKCILELDCTTTEKLLRGIQKITTEAGTHLNSLS